MKYFPCFEVVIRQVLISQTFAWCWACFLYLSFPESDSMVGGNTALSAVTSSQGTGTFRFHLFNSCEIIEEHAYHVRYGLVLLMGGLLGFVFPHLQ